MKTILLLPLIVVLGLTSCGPNQEQAYQQARNAAETQSDFTGPVGLNLRFGMTPNQVQARIDSLREHNELVFRLSYGQLEIEPQTEYLNGKLARFRMMLKGDGLTEDPEYQELVRLLSTQYGAVNYVHDSKIVERISWFKGATEIELTGIPARGYWLSYTALKQEWPLVQQQMREDSIREVREGKKL